MEATAERARSPENRFPGSKTELQVLYEALAKDSCSQTYIYLTEDIGKARVSLAERWRDQKPDSPTAKIASAMIWNQFAWAARGRGYASDRATARDAYGQVSDIDEWPAGGMQQFSSEVLPWIMQSDGSSSSSHQDE